MRARKVTISPLLTLAGFLGLLVLLWQGAFALHLVPSYALPSPAAVAARGLELARDGSLLASIEASLVRMVLGFVVAAAAGLLVGLGMGVSRVVEACLKSLFLGLQTLPSVAWVPIALLLFGLNDAAIYFVIVMSSMPAMAIATADGIAHIPPAYVRAARSLGATPLTLAFRVILPAALPGIVTGVKLGWTLGWHGVVSAELIKSSIGLGFLLHAGRELNDAAQVVAIMLVTVLLGLGMDRLLFGWAERRLHARWGFGPFGAPG